MSFDLEIFLDTSLFSKFVSFSFFHSLYFSEKNVLFLFSIVCTKLEKYIMIVLLFIVLFFWIGMRKPRIVPFEVQNFIESLYEFLMITVNQQSGKRSEKYFPFLFLLFIYILFSNIIGLIPFSFTVTGHIFQTFALSFSILIGLTIIGFLKHHLKFLTLFVPSGAPSFLLPLLVVIEIVSYISRAFSLAIRLFANMMAGHALLNIISANILVVLNIGMRPEINHPLKSIGLFFHYMSSIVGILLVSLLIFLELGISFLQAYVFLVLVSIYLNDSFKGGH